MLSGRSAFLAIYLVITTGILSHSDGAVCPYTPCMCSGKTIDCWNKHLNELPALQNNLTVGTYTDLNLYGNNISEIGDDSLPPGIVHLDLRMNPIRTISKSSFANSINTLKTIKFYEATFDSLPSALGELNYLQSLEIHYTTLAAHAYPSDILWRLARSVTKLTLSGVQLTAWPQWLDRFVFLHELDLSNNPIGDVPDISVNTWAEDLLHLDLSGTGATSLTSLQGLDALRSLDLSDNHVSDGKLLTYSLLPFFGTLESINFNNNDLTQLPRLESMTHLTQASFANNKLTDYDLAAFPNSLLYLDLSRNSLSKIPDPVRTLSALRSLDLRINQITEIGDHVFPTKSSLRDLYLGNNPIAAINSTAFQNVRQLKYLDLESTSLLLLPQALTAVDSLESLNMKSNNHLSCTCDKKMVGQWINGLTTMQVYGTCLQGNISTFASNVMTLCP